MQVTSKVPLPPFSTSLRSQLLAAPPFSVPTAALPVPLVSCASFRRYFVHKQVKTHLHISVFSLGTLTLKLRSTSECKKLPFKLIIEMGKIRSFPSMVPNDKCFTLWDQTVASFPIDRIRRTFTSFFSGAAMEAPRSDLMESHGACYCVQEATLS